MLQSNGCRQRRAAQNGAAAIRTYSRACYQRRGRSKSSLCNFVCRSESWEFVCLYALGFVGLTSSFSSKKWVRILNRQQNSTKGYEARFFVKPGLLILPLNRPRGNCNSHFENSHLETMRCFKTGHCSDLQRLLFMAL